MNQFLYFFSIQDIKPDNILLDEKGVAFITDFGISKVMQGTQLTTAALGVGTLNYLAPEMVQEGVPQTFAVDIWSAGGVVLEMCTGRPPFFDLQMPVHSRFPPRVLFLCNSAFIQTDSVKFSESKFCLSYRKKGSQIQMR